MGKIGTILGAIALGAATLGAGARHDETSLTVSPLVTELRSQPGTPDHIEIQISNNGARAERVIVTPLDWRTDTSGNVELQKPGANAARSLTSYISVSESQFPLPPGGRRLISLTVSLPARGVTASSLWGGVLVKATDAGSAATAMGPASTVFVYDDVGAPRRHVTMEALRLIPGRGGEGMLIARLRNDGDAYARAGAHLTVAQAGRVIVDRDVRIGAVFPGAVRLLQERVSGLEHGLATATLRVDYGGDVVLDGETHATVP